MVVYDDNGYPDATFVDEPDNRRPLFINGPIDNHGDLAPRLPEPISAEDLDTLKSEADMCPSIEDWAEGSMLDSSPGCTRNIAADNSDIDNFLREYSEFGKSGSKPVGNPNSSSAAHRSNPNFSVALTNSDGFAISTNESKTTPKDSGPFTTIEIPNISRPVPNSSTIRGSAVYGCPQPGRLMVMADTKKDRVSTSKVNRSPSNHPKSQVARTPTKANMRRPLSAPEASPMDEKRIHHGRIGKSNPVSRKWATEARAAPSVFTRELTSKPSNANTENDSSAESDTTSTKSSKSRENSGSSDSSPPDSPNGPPPAPKDPPAPGSNGSATRSKPVAPDRTADGHNSANSITVRCSANRGRHMSRSNSCPISASGPQTQSDPPLGNGGNGGGSSNPNDASSSNVIKYHNEERYFGFLARCSSASGVQVLGGGFDVNNSALWQNISPLPIIGDVNGPPRDSSALPPPLPYDSTTHNGSAIQNGSMPTYVPPIQNDPLPPNGAAMHNCSMPQNIAPAHSSRMDRGRMLPQVSSTQNGPVSSNGFPMQNGTMPPNSTPMQNWPVPRGAPLMRNDPMPPYAPQMQNGTVPPNGYAMQSGPMPQHVLPTQNGSVPQYGYLMQNGTVLSKGYLMQNDPMPPYGAQMENGTVTPNSHVMQNGSAPQYGPPIRNSSAGQYGPPVQNATARQYGPRVQNASVPRYGRPVQNPSVQLYGPPMRNATMPPIHNGTMPNSAPMHTGFRPANGPPVENGTVLYGPPMQNPPMPTNGGYFVNSTNTYISIPRNGVEGYAPNINAPNIQGACGYVPNGPNGCAPNGQVSNGDVPNDVPNEQGPNGDVSNGSDPNTQVFNGDANNRQVSNGPTKH